MPTDETLTARTLRGDASAFEQLINRYKNSVFTIIYRMTGQYQEAEDICQDVFITVYQKLYQYDRGKRFAPGFTKLPLILLLARCVKRTK